MKKVLYILAVACTLSFVACSSDDNDNNENTQGGEVVESTDAANLAVNTYAIDGVVAEFGSVLTMMVEENPSIVATPTAGISSTDAIFKCDEVLFASINPTLIGKEFDLMSETTLYTFMSTLSGAFLEGVAPKLTMEIEAGKATFTFSDNTLNVKADITLVDGTTLSFHVQAEHTAQINENIISSPYGEKPLRAAFYLEEDGLTYLYFTPGGISYFEEMDIVTWYLYIVVDSSMVNGQTIALSTVGENQAFMFGMIDNFDDSKSFSIMSGDLGDATGTINLTKHSEGNYTAIMDILYQGDEYSVLFTGDCTSTDEEMPVEQNYLQYKGEKFDVTAATLTKDGAVWSVDITASNNTTITVTAPAEFFDGVAHGFSQSDDFTVTYDGTTYSGAAGNSGTLTASLDESAQALTLDFTNYNNIILNYVGDVTIN